MLENYLFYWIVLKMMNSTNNGYINVYNSSSLVVPTGGLMAITAWSSIERVFNVRAPIDGDAIERLVVAPYTIQAHSKGIAYTNGICMVTQGSDVESYTRVGITTNDFVVTAGDLFTVLTYVTPGMCLIRLGGGGGGEASLDYVEIIESLTYPDPTGETQEEQLGRAYYRVRRLLHDIPPFNEAMEYANGQEVIYDNLAWLCQISEGTTTEVPGTGDDWVQSDLQIYAALGFDQVGSPYEAVPARDLRDCLPWLVAGQIVPLISVDKLGDGQETKYLLYSFFYTGSPASSSLRWNQEEKRVMAVFK